VLRSEREERKCEYPLLGETERPSSSILLRVDVFCHRRKPRPLKRGSGPSFALYLAAYVVKGEAQAVILSEGAEISINTSISHRRLMGSRNSLHHPFRERGAASVFECWPGSLASCLCSWGGFQEMLGH